MLIQISWLFKKPTDLDLHCSQRQDIAGFSRTWVKCQALLTLKMGNLNTCILCLCGWVGGGGWGGGGIEMVCVCVGGGGGGGGIEMVWGGGKWAIHNASFRNEKEEIYFLISIFFWIQSVKIISRFTDCVDTQNNMNQHILHDWRLLFTWWDSYSQLIFACNQRKVNKFKWPNIGLFTPHHIPLFQLWSISWSHDNLNGRFH